jgi:hypothetical protein
MLRPDAVARPVAGFDALIENRDAYLGSVSGSAGANDGFPPLGGRV